MNENGFVNTHFEHLPDDKFNILNFPKERIEGYMVSKRQ